MSEKATIKLVRILREFQEIINRFPSHEVREVVESTITHSPEREWLEALKLCPPLPNCRDTNVLFCCIHCSIRGSEKLVEEEKNKIWEELFALLEKEGLSVEQFLSKYQSLTKDCYHNSCKGGDSEWMVDWIADQIG